ncbi:RNA polymerase sigma factor [Patulibacter defluvii]|uniref:RNA polymerase sigma factor n=1 Tax=Patulibacter defluvii TaxID=3095358 RepID=UPI002A751CB5|nr:sigma-70 family RNA polymerase sigma factor [Patulibacter sp. DM4]
MSTRERRWPRRDDGAGGRWAVYDDHHAAVRRYVARRVEPGAVDDLTAETFAVAWRRLPRHMEDPLPWLYGVARRVVHGHRRSHARRTALVRKLGAAGDDRTTTGDPQERLTGDAVLAPAFAALSERDRETLALVAWEGLDNHRAARAAGCSPGTFAVRLTRAKARLQLALDAADPARPSPPEAPPARTGTPAAVRAAALTTRER